MDTKGSIGRMPLGDVFAHEAGRIVPADAERGLGQVVGAEGEELRRHRDVGGHQAGARQLDHGAHQIGDGLARFGLDLFGDGADAGVDDVELGPGGDQRDHHLGDRRRAGAAAGLHHRLEDGAGLHFGDLGVADGDAHAAMAEHRVDFLELGDAVGELFGIDADGLGHFPDLVGRTGEELVQRRVEQPDGDRQTGHDLEQRGEVLALHGQELVERGAAAFRVSARIISRTAAMRSASKNMCSVRHSPMPSAPNSRAMRASAGVSALARMPSRRISSAQPMTVSNSPDISGLTVAMAPRITWPVEPSSVITSPLASVTPDAVMHSRA
jgi:hypothetical protein